MRQEMPGQTETPSGKRNNRQVGAEMEGKACAFLEGKGLAVVERNFRCRLGEVDIVARDGATLVFVEVKYRNNALSGAPREAVDRAKQIQISKTALFYLSMKGYNESVGCRFDVVTLGSGGDEIIKNAFEFCYGR